MGIKVITTVVTAASSYDLTTLAIVKDELSITDGSKDTSLRRYITSASAAAAQYCNRKFQVETVKDEFWPERGPRQWALPGGVERLQLTRWPVVTVASVTENGSALVDGVDYRVDAENGALVRLDAGLYPRKWSAWPIAVQYDGGFSEIPEDAADAVVRMVTKRYSAKGRDATLKQESIPGVLERQFWIATGAEAGNMTPDITDILDNYRVPTLA
jgi:hypothetical protein